MYLCICLNQHYSVQSRCVAISWIPWIRAMDRGEMKRMTMVWGPGWQGLNNRTSILQLQFPANKPFNCQLLNWSWISPKYTIILVGAIQTVTAFVMVTLRINGTTTNDENLRPKHKNNGSKFSTRGESLQHLIDLLLSSQVARRDRERIPASVQCPWHFTGKFTSARGEGFVMFRTKNPLESTSNGPEEASLATPSGLKVSKDHTLSASAMLFTGFWSWHQAETWNAQNGWMIINGLSWHSFLGN